MNKMTGVARACAVAALVTGVAMLQGCATAQNRDPLESFNRKVFSFNEAVDNAVLKPVATGYVNVTPKPVRTGVSNFINNLKDVWSAINLVLQGRPGEAAQEVLRVSLNTTFGLAGFIDIARPMGLERHHEDLGQTLAVWGVPQGAYLVLPILGPSTTRDVADLPGSMYFSPSTLFREPRDANAVRLFTAVHVRAEALNATNLLGDIALDRYAFLRDAYLQRRQSLIYNGDPPDDDEDDGGQYDNGTGDDGGAAAPAPATTPVVPHSLLLMPESEPSGVVWHKELALLDPLEGALPPSSLAGRVLATSVSPGARASGPSGGALSATWPARVGPTPSSGNAGEQAAFPTAEELRGLRADADAR